MTDYKDEITRLRQVAAARQVQEQEQICKDILGDIESYEQAVIGAKESGDHDSALYYAQQINETEATLQQELAKLPQQPAPELSEATQTWIEGRDDLRGKPNYLFPHLSNDQVAVSVDKYLRSKGVQEGSPEYLDSLSRVVDPGDYQPMPTADDVLKTIQQTSKYGKDLSAKEYNRNAVKLHEAKKMGNYPER